MRSGSRPRSARCCCSPSPSTAWSACASTPPYAEGAPAVPADTGSAPPATAPREAPVADPPAGGDDARARLRGIAGRWETLLVSLLVLLLPVGQAISPE